MKLENRKAGEREDRPTPETDAEICKCRDGYWWVRPSVAKRLERERDEAMEKLTKACEDEHRMAVEVANITAERSDAEEERLRLEQELARVILQRQRLWEALADALEHVPSTLQGRARFALAEVNAAAS